MSEHERTRFCIIGGDGAIGSALEKSLRARGVAARSSTRRELVDRMTQFSLDLRGDLTDSAIPECDVIVLAAAMAKLADCRADPETARRVNVDAQVDLARRAARSGAFVVFLSTNQVFDGTKSSMRPRRDARSPFPIWEIESRSRNEIVAA